MNNKFLKVGLPVLCAMPVVGGASITLAEIFTQQTLEFNVESAKSFINVGQTPTFKLFCNDEIEHSLTNIILFNETGQIGTSDDVSSFTSEQELTFRLNVDPEAKIRIKCSMSFFVDKQKEPTTITDLTIVVNPEDANDIFWSTEDGQFQRNELYPEESTWPEAEWVDYATINQAYANQENVLSMCGQDMIYQLTNPEEYKFSDSPVTIESNFKQFDYYAEEVYTGEEPIPAGSAAFVSFDLVIKEGEKELLNLNVNNMLYVLSEVGIGVTENWIYQIAIQDWMYDCQIQIGKEGHPWSISFTDTFDGETKSFEASSNDSDMDAEDKLGDLMYRMNELDNNLSQKTPGPGHDDFWAVWPGYISKMQQEE